MNPVSAIEVHASSSMSTEDAYRPSLSEIAVDIAVDCAMQAVLAGDAVATRGWSESKRNELKRKWGEYIALAKQTREPPQLPSSSSLAASSPDLLTDPPLPAPQSSWRLTEAVPPLGPVQLGCAVGRPAPRMQRPKSNNSSFNSKYFALYQRLNQDLSSRSKLKTTISHERRDAPKDKLPSPRYELVGRYSFPPFLGCRVELRPLTPGQSSNNKRARAKIGNMIGRVVQIFPHEQSVLARLRTGSASFEYATIRWDHWGQAIVTKGSESADSTDDAVIDVPSTPIPSLKSILFDESDEDEEDGGKSGLGSDFMNHRGTAQLRSSLMSHLGESAAWDASLLSSISEEIPLPPTNSSADAIHSGHLIAGSATDTYDTVAEAAAVAEAERHFDAVERRIGRKRFRIRFGKDTSNATDAETIPKEEESGVDAYLIGKCKKVRRQANGTLKAVLSDVYIRYPDREWLCAKCSVVVRDSSQTASAALRI